jgi:hypothetical protein
MAEYKLKEGDTFAIMLPVYRLRSNFELWYEKRKDDIQPGENAYVTFLDEFDYFKSQAGNCDKTQNQYIDSLYEDAPFCRKTILDLTDCELKYQIRAGDELILRLHVDTHLTTAEEEIIDLRERGRVILSFPTNDQYAPPTLKAGSYRGQLQVTREGVRMSADPDIFIVEKDETYA